MELIHAKEAYANTLLAQRKARSIMFNDLAIYFNSYVNEITAQGKFACLIRWQDFDMDENLATDEEALTELLENIVSAGYEVELCYNSPSAFNPCGLVIGWGNNALEAISSIFANMNGELWRGEEYGI